MTADAHLHAGGGAADAVLLLPLAVAAVAYVAAIGERRRGRGWPLWRAAAWLAGLTAAGLGFAGPLAHAAHDGFVAHMAVHVLAGMVAPLLPVLAAPVTLALRTLATVPACRLSALLRTGPIRVLEPPVVAALLDVGALWVLYLTPLHRLMTQGPILHLLVTAHFLAAGCLFTGSLVAVDPSPHRASLPVRASVLVLALAAHGILAKLLYAHPPAGVPVAEAHAGAQFMFSAGDAVHLALLALLGAEWYRAGGRSLRRAQAGGTIALGGLRG